MSTSSPHPTGTREIKTSRWRIDPSRSSVEFRVPNMWGLATVKGRFERYDGTLDLQREPAIELTIEAASLNTKNKLRDKHLRSRDFFDVGNHPQVRFVSDSATLDGERLKIRGQLHAAGRSIPLDLEASLRLIGDELLTLRQTGSELGITTERAQQLEAKGLERLAGSPELEALRSAA